MRAHSLIVLGCCWLWSARALALEDYVNLIPNQVRVSDKACITCHNNPNGGAGCGPGTAFPDDPLGRCWNVFGRDFSLNARVWNAALAAQDSDGDGFTNGQELQDATGTWRYLISRANPGVRACVTPPGLAVTSSGPANPGDDLDRDQYCCIGRDANNDGDCRDAAESSAALGLLTDCDDADATKHPEQLQECVNSSLDNDCDGALGMSDRDCAHLVDDDGDGYCEVGRLQGTTDRFCLLPGEQVPPGDCNDATASVYPANIEACFDQLDNDCNDQLDLADDACMGEAARGDHDGDGYCAIGRDLNGDADCGDAGEDSAVSDCSDGQAAIHPGATELCFDRVDNNCDGRPDLEDDDCAVLIDADGDGYCTAGRDLTVPRDGDCADTGEDASVGDCDDADQTTHPGARESCLDQADHDCDGASGLVDSDCAAFIDHDGDGFCASGWDLDADGSCNSGAEPNGPRDCNDMDVAINPRAAEVCTDGVDNDCDGRRDGSDSDCGPRVDTDHDGVCQEGRDLNRDGDCIDQNESVGSPDCDPVDGTRYPGASENCFDDRDNDCNGLRDQNDAQCTGAYDADGDGYCPQGRDVNVDGDCLDIALDENTKQSDCDDGDLMVNPSAVEDCFDWIDNDCNALVDIADPLCAIHLDRDGDSFCGRGKDLNSDGDCLDGGERTSGSDCDETNALVFPGSSELCDDGLDNDCDSAADLADTECLCTTDAQCNDRNRCTIDRCTRDRQLCENIVNVDCGALDDAGVDVDDDAGDGIDGGDAGAPLPPLHGRDCDCQAVGAAPSPRGGWLIGFGFVALWALRRRQESRR